MRRPRRQAAVVARLQRGGASQSQQADQRPRDTVGGCGRRLESKTNGIGNRTDAPREILHLLPGLFDDDDNDYDVDDVVDYDDQLMTVDCGFSKNTTTGLYRGSDLHKI